MTLQEGIDFDQFVRCYCIGQEDVMIMPYDPRKPYLSGEQYVYDPNYLSPELAARVTNDVRTLCTALGTTSTRWSLRSRTAFLTRLIS